ncbi:MAG: hypothetical protein N3A54_00605 [Patescibacteria group bacterium]|nr:hypothetical protein [Patescibacteria group bacterium]
MLKEIAFLNKEIPRAKISSAVVYKGVIVSFGVNSYKTSPFQMRYSKNEHSIYLHAEIEAIKNASRYLMLEEFRKSSLLVCRVKYFPKLGKYGFGLAHPCTGCMKAIESFGIRKIIYTGELNEIFEKDLRKENWQCYFANSSL